MGIGTHGHTTAFWIYCTHYRFGTNSETACQNHELLAVRCMRVQSYQQLQYDIHHYGLLEERCHRSSQKDMGGKRTRSTKYINTHTRGGRLVIMAANSSCHVPPCNTVVVAGGPKEEHSLRDQHRAD